MNNPGPVFIADSCIGGLTVIKSLGNTGVLNEAIFLADYAINPLGTKSQTEIAEVVSRWFELAGRQSATLVIACNTLSVCYHQIPRSSPVFPPGPRHVVSMVDCFTAMAKAEALNLAGRKVLLIGTEFTASQAVYPEILTTALPAVEVNTYAATQLEHSIARLEFLEMNDSLVDKKLQNALEDVDVAVLACTCFPLVKDRLESLFPTVLFLDPGHYCADLVSSAPGTRVSNLQLRVTGDIVPSSRVLEFARNYLGHDMEVSC